ncbi:hypothetical protein ACHAW6_010504 [Cyclotella cf. meneghiniana]
MMLEELINAFNEHYSDEYLPSLLNCLDESMNTLLDKYVPGSMCVPCKPHPFGNEYHSIADDDDGKPILWCIQIQEGKDQPKLSSERWAFHQSSMYGQQVGSVALHRNHCFSQEGCLWQSLIKKQGKY